MRTNYKSLEGIDALYNEETQELAIFAAEGRVTHNEYKIVATGHGDVYNLIVDAYWNTEVFLCDSIIAAKALIEQLERCAEKEAEDYDWEADEEAYYWATR